MTKTPDLLPLVPLLTDVDAIHLPVRSFPAPGRHQAIESRAEYENNHGLSCGGSGDAADRKQHERRVDAWEEAGLVECTRRRGRRAFWRLTDRGDWTMRAFCGPYRGFEEMAVAMFSLLLNEQAGTNDGLVPEPWLVALDNWGPAFDRVRIVVETLILPGLVRGLVGWNTDHDGRVGYSLTAAGRKWLENPPPPPTGLPRYSPQAGRLYADSFLSTLEQLDATPTKGDRAVWICCSAGCWPAGKPVGPSILRKDGRPRSLSDFLRHWPK